MQANGLGFITRKLVGAYSSTYAPNALLYVLDYGNDRMQVLDPYNAFAYVFESPSRAALPPPPPPPLASPSV